MIKLTGVYFKILDAYLAGHDLIILQGGSGASKTYSALQFLYKHSTKESVLNKIMSVCSYALPHLKAGPMRDLDNIMISDNANPEAIKNRSENYYLVDSNTMEFFGIEGNLARVHGPRRDFLFINEVNHKITYEVFDQLKMRTRELTIVDYNPTSEFWIHDTVIPNFRHAFIKATYEDNQFLSERERLSILSKKDKPGFEQWWKVYGLGEVGQLEGCILKNWRFGEFDNSIPYAYGLDFGFHPDPDAMAKWAIDRKHKKIYADECFYRTEQTPGQLKDNVGNYAQRNDLIIADSADPRLIRELSTDFNIRGISKRGTVAEWLRIMQDYEIIITERSHSLAKELNNYVWNDKRAGIPIDGWDHIISGGRYVLMDQHQKSRGLKRLN